MSERVPRRPPSIPRRGGVLTRWFGLTILWLSGWRVRGELPDCPKLMMIGAPHSSAWDGIVGIAAAMALNIDFHWMGKDSLFRGPQGWFLRKLGGIATDRSNPRGAVGASVDQLRKAEALWLVLAPEGTRKPVQRWRSGYYHIAHGAGVPILQVYFSYPERVVGAGPLFHTSGDATREMPIIEAYYRPWRGCRGSGK